MPTQQPPQSSYIDYVPSAQSRFSLFGVIGLIFLLGSIIITGGIFLFKNVIQSKVEVARENIGTLEKELEPQTMATIYALDNKINKSSQFIVDHRYLSNIFDILELYTLRDVRYASFSYNADTNKITLLAKAKTYEAFAQQMDALKESGKFSDVDFSGLSLDPSGGVNFNLNMVLERSILLELPNNSTFESPPPAEDLADDGEEEDNQEE
ncbi:hypothetical protein ACFL3E_00160 [Patescibacteria group bacterium]